MVNDIPVPVIIFQNLQYSCICLYHQHYCAVDYTIIIYTCTVRVLLSFITCHVIVFTPLTNPRSPRAVHKMPYCPLSELILHNISLYLTLELDHVRKCTCKVIFSRFYSFFVQCHVHVLASLAVTCNTCLIDCGFGQYCTQYTPSRLHRSGVYRTVLPKAAVNNT